MTYQSIVWQSLILDFLMLLSRSSCNCDNLAQQTIPDYYRTKPDAKTACRYPSGSPWSANSVLTTLRSTDENHSNEKEVLYINGNLA